MSPPNENYQLDPRFIAGVDMLARTGSRQFQIRWHDDEEPVVWLAVGNWGPNKWDTAAGVTPLKAVLRLCEQIIDGGRCTRCGRPAGFDSENIEALDAEDWVCWYRYDSGAEKFIRGCD